ncbi:hypothetical protein L3556_14810 [Candidatus Synechococcus calcipolaris G9]|uniref:Uncharacterized protein n=1 Tax=Candidatus Synechococcus calcipolaris G9 TaxID=1497997 RepID=A0ABT6F330_9SYNE|nr:hypothetical protein [Candidatus Synechococcus calcipolaris]MDG2992188.1 hypothetical protein [Candidatus Synechococcus calcipolaris G9]
MVVTIFSTVLTALIVFSGWFLDQNALGCKSRVRAIFGLVPLAIGSWICLTIVFAFAFKVPGAYGPVQYWVGDMEAYRFISGPRTIAAFAILGGIFFAIISVLVTAIYVALNPSGSRLKGIITPSVALAIYGLAWWMFINCGFYPSA